MEEQELQERLKQFIEDVVGHKATLFLYMATKTSLKDWHGVEDAASDMRDLEAEQAAYERVLGWMGESEK